MRRARDPRRLAGRGLIIAAFPPRMTRVAPECDDLLEDVGPMALLIFFGALALIVSSLCSLLEASLLSVPRSHVEAMIERGSRSGRAIIIRVFLVPHVDEFLEIPSDFIENLIPIRDRLVDFVNSRTLGLSEPFDMRPQ